MSKQGQYAWSNPGQNPNFGGTDFPSGIEERCLKEVAQRVARNGMIGFDLGCHLGWTASKVIPVFMQHNGHFHLVDWCCGNVNTRVNNLWWQNEYPSKELLLQLLSNVECQGFKGVTVTVGTTLDLASTVADRSCDYIYIGGDHRYSKIKADLEAWLPKIRSGGVVIGHGWDGYVDLAAIPKEEWNSIWAGEELDFYSQFGVHLGINRAVTELLPNYQSQGNLWYSFR